MRTKERFYEVFNKVNETTLNKNISKGEDELINKFVEYCGNYLEIEDNIPPIEFIYDDDFSLEYHSFGAYYPTEKQITIVRHNRHIVDVFRTLAHELVHHKQNIENRLEVDSGDTGSNIENEANSVAAIIMRNFSKENPNIFKTK